MLRSWIVEPIVWAGSTVRDQLVIRAMNRVVWSFTQPWIDELSLRLLNIVRSVNELVSSTFGSIYWSGRIGAICGITDTSCHLGVFNLVNWGSPACRSCSGPGLARFELVSVLRDSAESTHSKIFHITTKSQPIHIRFVALYAFYNSLFSRLVVV